jgi:two-component SAPR family response regulator
VLGPVEVQERDAGEVQFRKSKSVELLCWLALHRDRPTASAARTALWEIDVEDATFHNVLSELRRGLSSVGHDDAAGRVNKQRLFLADGVVTDAELLRKLLREAESQEHESRESQEVIEKLVSVLSLVRGLPFADSGYAWADAEGITSTFVWLVTKAIKCVCDIAAECGDEAAMLEATAAGLRMSPGDEVFLARRPAVVIQRV